MLPNKAKQLDYMDMEFLINAHITKIEEFEDKNKFKFNFIVGKLRNGVLPAMIIANHLNVPMFLISAPRFQEQQNFEFLYPKDYESIIKSTSRVLVVDSICGTGSTLQEITAYMQDRFPSMQVFSYATLVDEGAKFKPTIEGYKSNLFFQPPWELRSFTPDTHLDRLEHNHIKSSKENTFYVGFSSKECIEDFSFIFPKKIKSEFVEVFDFSLFQKQISSTSGISSFRIDGLKSLSMEDLTGKANAYIQIYVEHILTSGFTHYVVDNIYAALLMAQECQTTNILYFDGKKIHRIKAKDFTVQELSKLG